MDRIRSELCDGYRRIEATMAGRIEDGEVVTRTMLDAARRSAEEATPTWLCAEVVETLSAQVPSPIETDVLVGAGDRGFLLFEKAVCSTTLGDAGSLGIAPVNGVLWWTADFDGQEFHQDADHPNLIVVHALSTLTSREMPWSPRVWSDSTLTDLGMFPMPLGIEGAPPSGLNNDLAPAVRLLLGYGVAVATSRVLFDTVADSSTCAPTLSAPRQVAVVYDA